MGVAVWRSVAIGSVLVAGGVLASTAWGQRESSPVPAADDEPDAATETDAGARGCDPGFVPMGDAQCCRAGEHVVAGACAGVPRACAPGEVFGGDRCVPRGCSDGWVPLAGHCCWPGQAWDETTHACTDAPHCPEGTWAIGQVGCGAPSTPSTPSTAVARTEAGRVHLGPAVFRMGSGERYVWLGAFAIDRTEVTVAAYGGCVRTGACLARGSAGEVHRAGDHPVTDVTYEMAARFCASTGARLPTEAEWEFAARGTDGRRYPWGERAPDCTLAQMEGCGGAVTAVGAHPSGASPFGVMDLAGNVAEWTADRAVLTLAAGSVRDPVGGRAGDLRVVRGGSFVSHDVRATARVARHAGEARFDLGFRCARGE